MSGKSSYLRTVCVNVVLAHCGCFVAAKWACLSPLDRLLTRMGTDDCLETHASTFSLEMLEMSYILRMATPRSLVVLVSLGRSTSTADGFAIAWGCCEMLLHLKAFTLVATHMPRLCDLATLYPNVKTGSLAVTVSDGHMDFRYTMCEGLCDVPHYGLLLAQAAGVPSAVSRDAAALVKVVEAREKQRWQAPPPVAHGALKSLYALMHRLCCLRHSTMPTEELRSHLLVRRAPPPHPGDGRLVSDGLHQDERETSEGSEWIHRNCRRSCARRRR